MAHLVFTSPPPMTSKQDLQAVYKRPEQTVILAHNVWLRAEKNKSSGASHKKHKESSERSGHKHKHDGERGKHHRKRHHSDSIGVEGEKETHGHVVSNEKEKEGQPTQIAVDETRESENVDHPVGGAVFADTETDDQVPPTQPMVDAANEPITHDESNILPANEHNDQADGMSDATPAAQVFISCLGDTPSGENTFEETMDTTPPTGMITRNSRRVAAVERKGENASPDVLLERQEEGASKGKENEEENGTETVNAVVGMVDMGVGVSANQQVDTENMMVEIEAENTIGGRTDEPEPSEKTMKPVKGSNHSDTMNEKEMKEMGAKDEGEKEGGRGRNTSENIDSSDEERVLRLVGDTEDESDSDGERNMPKQPTPRMSSRTKAEVSHTRTQDSDGDEREEGEYEQGEEESSEEEYTKGKRRRKGQGKTKAQNKKAKGAKKSKKKGPVDRAIYIANLSQGVTEEEIEKATRPFGKIHTIKIMPLPNVVKPTTKRSAIVLYTHQPDALKAISKLNRRRIGNSTVRVSLAKKSQQPRQKEPEVGKEKKDGVVDAMLLDLSEEEEEEEPPSSAPIEPPAPAPEEETNEAAQQGNTPQLVEGNNEADRRKPAKHFVCKAYLNTATCKYGSDCRFSHDVTPKISKIQDPCRYFVLRRCHKHHCRFSHDLPCVAYHSGDGCKDPACDFLHTPLDDEKRALLQKELEILALANQTVPSSTNQDDPASTNEIVPALANQMAPLPLVAHAEGLEGEETPPMRQTRSRARHV